MFCPECGIRNSEGASFCVRCGASLLADQPESATTLSYLPGDEPGEPNALAAVAGDEACLVIRSGGGRSGETYPLRGSRVSIGRHPDAAIFLDDVTVSRNHAQVVGYFERIRFGSKITCRGEHFTSRLKRVFHP